MAISWKAKLRGLLRDQRGQGMTEYIIIVALVAVGTIGAVTVFGRNVRALFATSADALGGTAAGSAGTSSVREKQTDLQNFASDVEDASE